VFSLLDSAIGVLLLINFGLLLTDVQPMVPHIAIKTKVYVNLALNIILFYTLKLDALVVV